MPTAAVPGGYLAQVKALIPLMCHIIPFTNWRTTSLLSSLRIRKPSGGAAFQAHMGRLLQRVCSPGSAMTAAASPTPKRSRQLRARHRSHDAAASLEQLSFVSPAHTPCTKWRTTSPVRVFAIASGRAPTLIRRYRVGTTGHALIVLWLIV